ncbi:uncharacterized protein [Symphalangus syndactylus]|uniref:uncharacterized protein isoform X10 n=1 Tax=Symphalangus syndactylus TaxID=9590 RepID=UPI0030052901
MGRLSGGWSPPKSRIHSAPSGLCLETPWHLRGWARVFPVSPLARNWAPLSLQPHPAPTSQHLPADEPPEDGQQVLALPLTCPPPLSPCGDLRSGSFHSRSCPASQSSSQPVHPQFLWDEDASKRSLPTSLLTGGLCDCGRTGPGRTHHLPPEAPPPRRHPRKIHRLAQTRRFLSSSSRVFFTPLDWFMNPFSYLCFLWMLNATFFVAER